MFEGSWYVSLLMTGDRRFRLWVRVRMARWGGGGALAPAFSAKRKVIPGSGAVCVPIGLPGLDRLLLRRLLPRFKKFQKNFKIRTDCVEAPSPTKTILKIPSRNKDFIFKLKLRLLPIWTKSKLKFHLFCLNSRYFKFQISLNSLIFWKRWNLHWKLYIFQNEFFSVEWGASAAALARARQGPHPHSQKKNSFWKIYNFQ